ncbi:MAG: DNA alkylation repair protein [Bacteroidetes bacterium]|nr:DNA alkylation repair protein [Bacteroidota bacterium]
MNKPEIRMLADQLSGLYANGEESDFSRLFRERLFSQKISFPYMEVVGEVLYERLGAERCLKITDGLANEEYVGGFVVAATVLQKHLRQDFSLSCKKAVEYMIAGNTWYVCDIIGERVFGYGLVNDFSKMFACLEKFIDHESHWIRRVVGVAVHVAAKRQIGQEKIEKLFYLSMRQAYEKNYHVKKGCGWGIETIAKFYPDFAVSARHLVEEDPKVNSWIRKDRPLMTWRMS